VDRSRVEHARLTAYVIHLVKFKNLHVPFTCG
jgi:hypothetical protein